MGSGSTTQKGGVSTSAKDWLFEKVSDPDSNIGTHPAVRLTNGVEVTVRIEFYMPHEFTDAEIILVPGDDGNLRRSVVTNWGGQNENYNVDGGGAIVAGQVAVNLDEMEFIDITAALVGIVAGDLVGVEFTRHADNANDTVEADCFLIGLRYR